MTKKMLVEYIKRPAAVHCTTEFANAVMKEFGGRKAKTPVELLVKSYIQNLKLGVLVAMPNDDDNYVHISYAKWNWDLDDYDKHVMMDVAVERMVKFSLKPDTFSPKVPFEVARRLPAFMARCRRYYKDCTFPKWTDKYVDPEV
jgi:hypothetical protein